MPIELASLVDPAHTAVVTQECQKAVLGETAVFPELAEAAREAMIPNGARLVKQARRVGAHVVHCIFERRPDGVGSSTNARIFGAARKSGATLTQGSEGVQVIDEIGLEETDLVSSRLHGIGPMWGTDLDALLRNLGTRTVVAVGVSVNVGITNLVMDAVNAGYQVVLPRDAVAGIPASYASSVIDNTLAILATICTTDDVLGAWS
ncbi:MAG: isochorismatase family protein [Actinomycetota bacterium]